MKVSEELRHLLKGLNSQEKPQQGSLLMPFNVYCQSNANEVLEKSKEVLEIVLKKSDSNWLSETEWYNLLPQWFIERCTPEITKKEIVGKLDEQAWSVINWVNWFEPTDDPYNQRYWFWWDAWIKSNSHIVIVVQAVDLPFPWGALEWLMLASGAIEVKEADFVPGI